MSRRKTAPRTGHSHPDRDPSAPVASRKRTWPVAAALSVFLFFVYVANFRVVSSGDNIPTRLLPFSIVREGDLDLDEFQWLHWPLGRRLPYYIHEHNGHLYSGTTVATSLLIAPFYIVPDMLLRRLDISYDDVRARLIIVAMERLSAAFLVALSAALLYVVLRRLAPAAWAVVLTLTYALGTNTWVTSSQGLWSHTFSELALVILSMIFLSPHVSRSGVVLAGMTAAVAVTNRPQTLIFAALAAAFVWERHRRDFVAFVAAPAAVAIVLATYNLRLFHGLAGGYFGFDHFSTSLISGVAGLLLSPNRGLFVFAPITLFAFVGAVSVWQRYHLPWLRYLSAGVAAHLVLYGKFDNWWAGYAYGPRYMTDLSPVLCILLVPGLIPLCRGWWMRTLAGTLILYGIGVQCVGVYFDDDDWNRAPASVDLRPARVWDWSDWQVLRAARRGWKGLELLPLFREAFSDSEPARLESLAPADLSAEFEVLQAPARLQPGARSVATIALRNAGTRTWPAFSGDIRVRYRVFVVVRWLVGNNPVERAGEVIPLPENLSPGETVHVRIPLVAPEMPGRYEVEVSVAQAFDGARGVRGLRTAEFAVVVA